MSDDPALDVRRGDGRTVYRLSDTSEPTEEDWQSPFARGDRPRKAQIPNVLIHLGLSMTDRPEPLLSLRRAFPNLGDFIVDVELRGDLGVWFADTLWDGHYTVWGRPSDLVRCARLPGHAV